MMKLAEDRLNLFSSSTSNMSTALVSCNVAGIHSSYDLMTRSGNRWAALPCSSSVFLQLFQVEYLLFCYLNIRHKTSLRVWEVRHLKTFNLNFPSVVEPILQIEPSVSNTKSTNLKNYYSKKGRKIWAQFRSKKLQRNTVIS